MGASTGLRAKELMNPAFLFVSTWVAPLAHYTEQCHQSGTLFPTDVLSLGVPHAAHLGRQLRITLLITDVRETMRNSYYERK